MKGNQSEYAILGLLSMQSHLSGYDLRKAVQNSIGFFWGESYGQIYPALKRLTADGLIEPVKQRPERKKRRQEYAITEAGRARLREWLALPFHNDPPRNEFLLKFFFGGEAGPDVALAHLREVQRRNQQMQATLAAIQSTVPNGPTHPHQRYWLLALRLGQALTETALAWGESALAELQDRPANHDTKRNEP
jgi:DNA-binding PadR family transcriptional regulator